ncbi:MAG TPA: MBL fold metallo-hydrolase [Bacteroidia bacterium]|jgi:glyoxylase-like metal-dependent hydrolase (beta-lactamase superfamily II)|nr:MBL fold metallo-hydrolase [Bacteroidia bacterium]
MTTVKQFTFNPFAENTYVVSDETGECVIIDPGCHISEEEEELTQYITSQKLKPVKLLNTHCHVDHVFGNYFVSQKWGLGLEMHKDDLNVLASFPMVCEMYGFPGGPQPEPKVFLEEGQQVKFGNTKFDIFFTPGHSPGSVCFYSREDKVVIGGDVLFQNSIGRTDLPGGNHEQLLQSIREKLFVLPDEVKVYCGHGPFTTIGWEKKHNPFVGE